MDFKNLKLEYLDLKTPYHKDLSDVITEPNERNYYFSDRPDISFKSVSTFSKKLLPKYLVEIFGKNKKETPAMKRGTLIHLFLENYFKQDDENLKNMSLSTNDAIHAYNIIRYIENNFTKVLMLEEVVRSDKYKYAGRIDFLGESNGSICLVDFKIASNPNKLSEDMIKVYLFQLACYANALIESGYNVKEVILLRSLPLTRRYNIIKISVDKILHLLNSFTFN